MSKSGSLRVSQDVYIVGGADLSHPYDCSVYLVDGGEEMVHIDTGVGEGFELIVDNIRSLGLRPDKLKAVIATHSHITSILWTTMIISPILQSLHIAIDR